MKRLIFLLMLIFISGCSFIVMDVIEEGNFKTFGIKKDDASKLTKEIERQKPKDLPEFYIMKKKEQQEFIPQEISESELPTIEGQKIK